MEFNLESFDDLANFIDKLNDDFFWKPINSDETSLTEFKRLLFDVEDSANWDRKLNWKKGRVLEDLAVFIFSRFQDIHVSKNNLTGDNESDIEVRLSEKVRPTFMTDYIGPKIICECKNYKTKSIDVGMVSKLAELIPLRGARFGVFFSVKGIGGYDWRYGEGKRKKILYKEDIPMISFTLKELAKLSDGTNFYTMIKQKVKALFDEVDDDSPDFPPKGHLEYTKRLLEIVTHFKKSEIISDTESEDLKTRIFSVYGNREE